MQQHGTPQECEEAVRGQLDEAFASGRWMVAVWNVDQGGKIHVRRTTCDFPTSEFGNAIRMLKGNLSEEVGLGAVPFAALPFAPHLLKRQNAEENGNGERKDDDNA